MSWNKKTYCSIINESSLIFFITFTASVVPEDVEISSVCFSRRGVFKFETSVMDSGRAYRCFYALSM